MAALYPEHVAGIRLWGSYVENAEATRPPGAPLERAWTLQQLYKRQILLRT